MSHIEIYPKTPLKELRRLKHTERRRAVVQICRETWAELAGEELPIDEVKFIGVTGTKALEYMLATPLIHLSDKTGWGYDDPRMVVAQGYTGVDVAAESGMLLRKRRATLGYNDDDARMRGTESLDLRIGNVDSFREHLLYGLDQYCLQEEFCETEIDVLGRLGFSNDEVRRRVLPLLLADPADWDSAGEYMDKREAEDRLYDPKKYYRTIREEERLIRSRRNLEAVHER